MSAEPDFRPEIRRAVADLGRVAQADEIDALNSDLAGRWFVDVASGHVHVATARGPVLDAQTAIRDVVGGWAGPAEPAGPAVPEYVRLKVNGSTSIRPADDPMVRIVSGIQAAEAAKTARQVATWPNPWTAGQENRTRQTIIKNTNPTLAEKFMREARK